jgi:hypothetical protein
VFFRIIQASPKAINHFFIVAVIADKRIPNIKLKDKLWFEFRNFSRRIFLCKSVDRKKATD